MAKEVTKPEEKIEMSNKDRYLNRYKKMYPDMDMENEDDFYGAANSNMDELESHRQNNSELIDVFNKNEAFASMLMAAKDGQDPFEWLAENLGADISVLVNNPEYAKKISEAAQKYNESQVKGAENNKLFQENMSKSLNDLNDVREELGLSNDEAYDLVSFVYDVIGEALQGVITVDTFKIFMQGRNYDKSVASARNEGEVAGRNAKIGEQLRSKQTPSGMPPSLSSSQGQSPQPAQDKKSSFWSDVK